MAAAVDAAPQRLDHHLVQGDGARVLPVAAESTSPQRSVLRLRLQGAGPAQPGRPSKFADLFDGFSLAPQEDLAKALAKLREAEGGGGEGRAAALLAVADARLASEEPQQALREAEEALAALREHQDAEGEAAGLQVLAKVYFAKGEEAAALEGAKAALAAFRSMGHGVGEAAALGLLAQVRLAADHSEALVLARQAQALFTGLGDRRRAAMVQRTIMGAHLASGDTGEALKVARQLLSTCRDLGDRHGEAATTVLVAEVYGGLGQTDEALRWSHEAAEAFREVADGRNEAAARYAIAKLHLKRNEGKDLDQGIRAATVARQLFRDLGEGEKELVLTSVLNAVDFLRGRRDEALASAKEALRLAEARGCKRGLAAALHEVMHVHLSRGEPREARRAANEARAVYQDLGRQSAEADVLSGIACAYFMDHKPDDALKAASEMLAIYRREGDRRREAELLLEIGALQLDRRMPTRALRAVEPALAMFRGIGDSVNARKCAEVVAFAHRMRDAMKEAVGGARDAMAQYQQHGDPNGLFVAARIAYDVRASFGESSGCTAASAAAVAARRSAPGAGVDQGPDASGPLAHQPWSCDWCPGEGQQKPAMGMRRAGLRHNLREAGALLWKPLPPQLQPLPTAAAATAEKPKTGGSAPDTV